MMRRDIILTLDCESVFHAHPFYDDLSSLQRLEADAGSTRVAMEIFGDIVIKSGSHATIFVVAEIAEWYPDCIEAMFAADHEIAFHGYDHRIMRHKRDVSDQLSLAAEFLSSYRPIGCRGPWYVFPETAAGILSQHGFLYDSSGYGSTGPFQLTKEILEIPVPLVPWRKNARNADQIPGKPLAIRHFLHGIPLGSGMIWALPVDRILRLLERAWRIGLTPMLTVHPWQLYRPRHQYFLRKTFLLTHPWWIPYAGDARKKIQSVLSRIPGTSTRNYFDFPPLTR